MKARITLIPGPRVGRSVRPGWVSATDVVETEVRWLWPGMIPLGGLTLVEGPPGCGKSTLLRDIAARITSGQAMPGMAGAGEVGGIIWCTSEEDTSAVLVPGLRRAGVDKSRAFLLDDDADGGWESARLNIRDMIIENDVRLVVLDNVAVFLGPEGDDYLSVQKALRPWAKLARDLSVAMAGVRHTRKSGATVAVNAGIGSIAWSGIARATITVGELDTGVSACALAKANLGPKPDPYEFTISDRGVLSWLGRTEGGDANNITDTEARRPKKERKPNAVGRLRAILDAGPCPEADILEALKDLSEGTVRNAASSLGVVHEGPIWKLP